MGTLRKLYFHKFGNSDEMKFFERYDLPKHNQEEIDNLNSPISIKENKFIVYNTPIKKIPG